MSQRWWYLFTHGCNGRHCARVICCELHFCKRHETCTRVGGSETWYQDVTAGGGSIRAETGGIEKGWSRWWKYIAAQVNGKWCWMMWECAAMILKEIWYASWRTRSDGGWASRRLERIRSSWCNTMAICRWNTC